MNEKIEIYGFRALVLAWAAFIFYMSSRGGSGSHIDPPFDKVLHFGAFFGLGYLMSLGSGLQHRVKFLFIIPILVSLYGASDEFHQSFVPGRTVDILDWTADTVGGLAAVLAWWLSWRQGKREGMDEGWAWAFQHMAEQGQVVTAAPEAMASTTATTSPAFAASSAGAPVAATEPLATKLPESDESGKDPLQLW